MEEFQQKYRQIEGDAWHKIGQLIPQIVCDDLGTIGLPGFNLAWPFEGSIMMDTLNPGDNPIYDKIREMK